MVLAVRKGRGLEGGRNGAGMGGVGGAWGTGWGFRLRFYLFQDAPKAAFGEVVLLKAFQTRL